MKTSNQNDSEIKDRDAVDEQWAAWSFETSNEALKSTRGTQITKS